VWTGAGEACGVNGRRWVVVFLVLAVVSTVVAAVLVLRSEFSSGESQEAADAAAVQPVVTPATVATDFLVAVAAGKDAAAAQLTDDPAAAEAALIRVRAGLSPQRVETSLDPLPAPKDGTGELRGTFTITWTLEGGRVWSYDNAIGLVRSGQGWQVHWAPSLLHPDLGEGQRMALHTGNGEPAVVDRAGTPLLAWQAGAPVAVKELAGEKPPLLLPALGRVAAEQAQGKDSWSVELVDADGNEVATLYEQEGEDGEEVEPLTTTLDLATQQAAQAAVDGAGAPALLVAMQPSSGDLLAVAQSAEAGGDPHSLSGLYAPGSTFKIATAAAALEAGSATPDSVLPCPGRAQISTRSIPNDGEFDLGDVPLHTAFAHSCNTTFAGLAADLPADALADAATQLGLNADFVIPGITTEAGKVEPATDAVTRLEDGIGQGKVQASPFGVALMSATVAAGEAVTPRLWRDLDTSVHTGYDAPPAGVLTSIRAMMREVVTDGTATELRGFGDVRGKTGTAQFLSGDQAHGWFTGYRGDLAFAVVVLRANASDPAVAVTADFLGALPG
jgi:beta-lactamase class D